jgi:hypothetical protein
MLGSKDRVPPEPQVVTLAVADGRVGCPRYGDVSVEACFDCELVDAIDDERGVVQCRLRGASTVSRFEIPRDAFA